MAKIVTMGEIMMRLSPPGNQRFIQAQQMEIHYGGAEANVAAVLAGFGHDVSYVTRVPAHAIGDCVIASLRKNGVDPSLVVRGGDRLGLYFLENGASVRPTSVVYDRADSAMAKASVEDFDFDRIFQGVELFHTSGITASISEQGAEITLRALEEAKKRGIRTSFDINYRAKLWQTGVEKRQEMFRKILPLVDICFGNPLDAWKTAGYTPADGVVDRPYEEWISDSLMKEMAETYGMEYIITSRRISLSATDNDYSALVWDGSSVKESASYRVHIVDRVGTGDAMSAGFLHGILNGQQAEEAIGFGAAAAALKHTMPGDVLFASVQEVKNLMLDGQGRVVR